MEASSGVWALCWNGDAQLFAGTRKDGIVMAGRSWKWTEPQPVKEEPAEDSEPETDDSKPAEETPAESEPESKADAEKPAAETPEPSKPDAEAVKQDGESADNSEKKE